MFVKDNFFGNILDSRTFCPCFNFLPHCKTRVAYQALVKSSFMLLQCIQAAQVGINDCALSSAVVVCEGNASSSSVGL